MILGNHTRKLPKGNTWRRGKQCHCECVYIHDLEVGGIIYEANFGKYKASDIIYSYITMHYQGSGGEEGIRTLDTR